MSGGRTFGTKTRRIACGMAVIGVTALIAACSPVKMGAAAIVGSQRITQSSLDNQVGNLQTDLAPYRSQLPGVTQQELVNAVLSWMISFQIQDRLAASEGITVTPAQAQTGLKYFYAAEQSAAAQQGQTFNQNSALPLNAIPQSLETQFGQFIYQQLAFYAKHNGGKQPSSQTEQTALGTLLAKDSCLTEKSLNVQVSPQFGQLAPSQSAGLYSILAGNDTLSRVAGPASPAATPSFAC